MVVLHFWTFGCENCQHNYPALKAWHEKYAEKGVTIIGVHTPETAREARIENVRSSVEESGLKYPIVFDKDARTWKAWGNRWWPSTYLIDKEGFVRYRWDGEFNWKNAKGEADHAEENRAAARRTETLGMMTNASLNARNGTGIMEFPNSRYDWIGLSDRVVKCRTAKRQSERDCSMRDPTTPIANRPIECFDCVAIELRRQRADSIRRK